MDTKEDAHFVLGGMKNGFPPGVGEGKVVELIEVLTKNEHLECNSLPTKTDLTLKGLKISCCVSEALRKHHYGAYTTGYRRRVSVYKDI